MTARSSRPKRLSWSEVCARRLARHALSTPAQNARPADIVAAIGGAHAQVLSAAELSIAIRTASLCRSDIRDALWSERTLVKAFGPRGTVHLLATRDLPVWTAALSAIPHPSNSLPIDARLTREQTEEVVEAIAAAVADVTLTIDELDEAILSRTGTWAGDLVTPAFRGMWPRWRQALGVAGNRGAVCFGPNQGRKVTYTSPQRWLPGLEAADPQDALTAIVRRYLHAYGPATPQQFAQWLAAPRRWAVQLFDSLSDQLEQVEVDGTIASVIAGDTTPDPLTPGVRLLPYFDAYTVGCHPRPLLFPGVAAGRALSRGQAGNLPVLLIDGTVAGIWHQRRSAGGLEIVVEPFVPLTTAQRDGLDDQAARIGEILAADHHLTIGVVTVAHHA